MRLISVGLPLVALLAAAATAPAAAQVPVVSTLPPSHTLTVSASADVPATPDQAVVQLGVTSRATTAQAAMNQTNTAMDKVIAALKQLGIPDMDIQTAQLSLTPVYNQPPPTATNQTPQLVGFDATNIVSVILTGSNFNQVGPAIDAGLGAGANQIQGISFQLSNDEPFRLQALKQAGAQAQARAAALAAGLGITLQGVDAVTEGSTAVTPVSAGAVPAATVAPTPVSPGQVMVHVDIQVRFVIQ